MLRERNLACTYNTFNTILSRKLVLIFWKKRCRHINYENLSVQKLKILDTIGFAICLISRPSIMYRKNLSFLRNKNEKN